MCGPAPDSKLTGGFGEVDSALLRDKSCVVASHPLDNSAIRCKWCFGVTCSMDEGRRRCLVLLVVVLDGSVQQCC